MLNKGGFMGKMVDYLHFLVQQGIPEKQTGHYKNWVERYGDFCKKSD